MKEKNGVLMKDKEKSYFPSDLSRQMKYFKKIKAL